MFNLLGSIAQFERELTRERMLVGIAKARADGKYKGRAPTARAKADKVRELRDAGIRPAEIARQVGITRTSVYRVLGCGDSNEVAPASPDSPSDRVSVACPHAWPQA